MGVKKVMAKDKRRPRGSGSVFRTDTGWIAQIRVMDPFTGKSKQVRRRAKSRDQARRLLAELQGASETTKSPKGSVSGFLHSWIAGPLQQTSLSPNGKTLYAGLLEYYAIPAAQDLNMTDLDVETAGLWLERISQSKKRTGDRVSASTVKNTRAAVIKALDFAVKKGSLTRNFMRETEAPRLTRPKVPVTSQREVDRVLREVAGRRIETVVWFVSFTGCRIGEALALKWDDVDLETGSVTIRTGSFTRESTKTGRTRSLTLLPEVVERLAVWKTQQKRERLLMGAGWKNGEGYVFTTATGGRVDRHTASRDLRQVLAAADVTTARPWHSLRHGLAYRLLDRGVPLHVVSSILGHSGIQVTADVYGHVDSQIPVSVLQEALDR